MLGLRAFRRRSRPIPRVRCSFCGVLPDATRRFFEGPSVYICDLCVARAQSALTRPGVEGGGEDA